MRSQDECRQHMEVEMEQAHTAYGLFTSTHEGLGVLFEEFDELRSAIHANNLDDVQHEALQVAAVAMRLAISVLDPYTAARSVPQALA
jgi:NTP pyrophosphatase (non-canonical NTP hydrolase)